MSAAVDRSRAPAGDAPKRVRFPDVDRRSLASGLPLWCLRRAEVGLVRIELVFPGGGIHAPPERPGLAAVAGALVTEGTRDHDATEVARRVERLGGSLSSGCDWDGSSVALQALSRTLDASLDVFGEVVNEADFPPEAIDRQRRQRLAELERRYRDPGSLAALAFARAAYGEQGYGVPLIGNRASLEALTREELAAFFRDTAWSDRSALIAVGDFDPAALAPRLEALFGGLALAPAPAPTPVVAASPEGRRVWLVDRPEAAQTELRIGHVACARSHPGRGRRLVLNTLLGGKFTSRINLNLRERHGYTYGASSSFVERLQPGPFVVATAVANEVAGAAAREILFELERLRTEAPEEEEVRDARNYLLGVFPYTLQTIGGLASRLDELIVHRLPTDFYDRQEREIATVTPDDVLATARELLLPDRAEIVAVGPANTLADALAELGPVEQLDPAVLAGLEG